MSLYERRHNNGTLAMKMGVVIDNQSDDSKSVWFLGYKQKRVKDVSIHNMFADTFMGDKSMSMFQNWLLGIGHVEIAIVRLKSDGDMRHNIGSIIKINTTDATGTDRDEGVINIWNHFNPEQFSFSLLDIQMKMRIDAYTSFNVEMKPNSKVAIMFFPSNHIDNAKKFSTPKYENMYNGFEKENKDYSSNNRKKYLLLLR